MTRQEIMNTPYGEMADMIACLSIYEGLAEPKKIKLNRAWFLFYGRKLNMTRQEIMTTPLGEMLDMIACLSIYEGLAEPKKIKRKWNYDEAMSLK